MEKVKAHISKLTVNDASYSSTNVSISPTLINFFYGNNGSGKSTIAKTFNKTENIQWENNAPPSDYIIQIYNSEYVQNNIANYHNLTGVYTFGEMNIDIQNRIDELRTEKEKLETELLTINQKKINLSSTKNTLLANFQDSAWHEYTKYKNAFPQALTGYKNKKTFVEELLRKTNKQFHEFSQLMDVYNAAYSSNDVPFQKFHEIENTSVLDQLNDTTLLGKPIVSRSDTPFSDFIKALNATEWVKQGIDHYHESANGKCLFCQQPLPYDFDEEIAKCFDEQFQIETKQINALYDAYRNTANTEFVAISKLPNSNINSSDIELYKNKLEALKGIIASNFQKLLEKKQNYSLIVHLDETAPLFEELKTLIIRFNKQIKEYNDIITARPAKKEALKAKIWEAIAFELDDMTSEYKRKISDIESSINSLSTEGINRQRRITSITYEISDEMKNIVNTKATIDSINLILKDTGFQGFYIREKINVPNVYEVVRHDGSLAKNLSEGEKNFITFLYFYHQVKGNISANSNTTNKIVVIDDPVSSMDSGSLFIIASLIRELIKICENNAIANDNYVTERYIKQIFILTHNTYFHKEISYEYVKCYPYVNLYLVVKNDTQSRIKLCERDHPTKLTEKVNYNPVQNSYSALWEEYKSLNTPIPLMNVMRRILEYYFLQLCGYDGTTLREILLNKNKNNFITINDDGTPDYTHYQIASAMLAYIHSNSSVGMIDGMYYVDDAIDIQQSKATFKLIFELMNQNQHFEMMMNTTN